MFVLLFLLALGPGTSASTPEGRDDLRVQRAAIESGDYERAEEVARRQLDGVRANATSDPLAVARASRLYVDALILNGKGALPSTVSLAQEALRLSEKQRGSGSGDRATFLVSVGRTLTSAGRYLDAIPVLTQAVALSEKQPDEPDSLIEALDALGRVLDRAGRYDEALVALRRCVGLEEASHAALRQRARTMQALTSVLQAKSDYPAARTAVDRAIALHAEAGANHAAAVDTWIQLGSQFWFEGRLGDSQAALMRAVQLAESTLRADHPSIALALRKLAATEVDLGNTAAARGLHERALSIAERSLPPEHVEVAAYFNGLANTNMLTGDYPAARRQYERALAIARARFGERHDWVATYIHNLALVDSRLGDFVAARREHGRAIAIWESVYGRTHPVVAVALVEMADAWTQEGSPAAAIPMLERALAIRTARFGPNHRDVARTMALLALALERGGQTTPARRMVDQARAIFDGMSDPPPPDVAQVLTLSAERSVRRGDFAAAVRDYSTARDIRAGLFGASHPLVAETEAGLAQARAAVGDRDGAFALASDAETTAREHLRLTLRYLPERESLNFQRNRTRGLDLMLSLAADAPALAGPAFDAVIRNRALVLDEMMSRRRTDASASPDVARLEAQLEAARRRLATLIVRGTSGEDRAPSRAVLEAAQRDSEAAESVLAASSADYRAAQARARFGLQDVQSMLPADTTLVAFVRFDRYLEARPGGKAGAQTIRRTPSYAAFVLAAGASPRLVTLGAAQEIDALVSRWRQRIAAEAAAESDDSSGESRAAGAILRRRLWDPLLLTADTPRRVLIVPDGTISLVPFGALPVGSRSFLIEGDATLHYLTAERDVTEPAAGSAAGRGLLALGGASFGAPRVTGSAATAGLQPSPASGSRSADEGCTSLGQFEPLDGTRAEVQQVARVWKAATGSTDDVRVLEGTTAREDLFARYAPGTRVIHLATHGFFLDAGCAERIPGTRAVGGLAPVRPVRSQPARRPLAGISALALAGANNRSSAKSNDADGILLAEEVAALRLSGVEWAVLSACDTGIGALVAGEGVLGLRRAFQIAGVRTVIMTLWPVDDRATTELMRQLYTARFVNGLASDQAMRAASLSVLRARRAAGRSTHPFFWAAFLAAGDWR